MDTKYYSYPKSRPQDAFGCTLVYNNKAAFKRWAVRHGLSKKNGADFYFDFITPVDARDDRQPDIPGFLADGSTTWGEALKKLARHFRIKLAKA